MKKNKIFFNLILFLFLLLLAIPADATETAATISFTQDNYYKIREEVYKKEKPKLNKFSTFTFNGEAPLEEYLITQVKLMNPNIDVSMYNILETDINALVLKVFEVPELFFVDPTSVRYYRYEDTETGLVYVKSLEFTYLMSEVEINDSNAIIDGVVKEYLAGIQSSWNDLEKIIYTKDFLCKNCSYAKNIITTSHTLYGALVDKEPVCDGYSKAFNYLLSKVGINTLFVTSSAMSHAWSMVELNGNYYHVDVTWDDDDGGVGRTRYMHFIVSDSGMSDSGRQHYSWVVPGNVTATNTKYDREFWYGNENYLIYKDYLWYYVVGTTQVNSLMFNCADLRVDPITITSKSIDTEYVLYKAGLTSLRNNMYFTTMSSIYKINFPCDVVEKIYTLPNPSEKVIYSIECIDGKFYYDTIDIVNGSTVPTTRKTNELVYYPITGLSLDKTKLTLELGVTETYTLNATITPSNTTDDTSLIWRSNDKKVATVDANGKVTAVGEGKTIVYAAAVNGITATCQVEVIPKLVYTTLKEEQFDDILAISFEDKTAISEVITAENFPVLDRGYTVEVLTQEGTKKANSDYMGSYNKIIIKDKSGNTAREYSVAVSGDVTGDGKVRLYDAFQILKNVLYGKQLSLFDKHIRDYNLDGRVALYDAFRFIRKVILS